MATSRKRVVKVDTTSPTLVVEGDKIVEVEPIEVAAEIETPEDPEDNGKPKHRIQTDAGEAVYEYFADCVDCAAEGKTMPVFVCTSGNIRADEMMGNQLAGFWNDGGGISTPLCLRHYNIRLGGVPKSDPTTEYKVLERY